MTWVIATNGRNGIDFRSRPVNKQIAHGPVQTAQRFVSKHAARRHAYVGWGEYPVRYSDAVCRHLQVPNSVRLAAEIRLAVLRSQNV